MKRLRVLIVDDEPVARDGLRAMLADDPEIEVIDAVESGRAAVKAIERHAPDLVFLDVRMPDLDGFGVLDALDPPSPAVVFVTAYEEFAVRAFEVHALDYLLKPFGDARLKRTLKHAKRQIARGRAGTLAAGINVLRGSVGSPAREAEDEPLGDRANERFIRRLTVKRGGRRLVIDVSRIDWLEGAGDYVELHVEDAGHLIRATLRELEDSLDPGQFARIHRSAIVNLDRVREHYPLSHGDHAVILGDGTRLRLSRTYREHFLKVVDGRKS